MGQIPRHTDHIDPSHRLCFYPLWYRLQRRRRRRRRRRHRSSKVIVAIASYRCKERERVSDSLSISNLIACVISLPETLQFHSTAEKEGIDLFIPKITITPKHYIFVLYTLFFISFGFFFRVTLHIPTLIISDLT